MSFSLKKCYNNDGDYMMIVFGGAFNPPTIAHLNIIKKLLSTYKGSHVLLLPVGNDYSKSEFFDYLIPLGKPLFSRKGSYFYNKCKKCF